MERNGSLRFAPAKTAGILFMTLVLGCLISAEIALGVNFLKAAPGLSYFLLLIGLLALLVPLALIGYRLYSLLFSAYILERNSFQIKWGFRIETIPMNAIEWVRTPIEMPFEIPWSVLPMPGAYLGTRNTREYGQIEFLASSVSKMIFVGTAHCVYAISPQNPGLFIDGFYRILQMGTLNEIEWKTIRPANWLLTAWNNKICRISSILSLNLLTVLFLWIGFRLPHFKTISLQFSAAGSAEEVLPVSNIILIPVLAGVFFLADAVVGVRLYTVESLRRVAEEIWCAGTFTIFLFLIAGFYLL